MNKTRKIILCIVLCALAAVPYLILIDYNKITAPYPPIDLQSGFRVMSVIYCAEFILSLAGIFLLYVKSMDSDSNNTLGCVSVLFAAFSVFCMWQLTDFGEGVRWNRFYESFSRIKHPEMSGFIFYACLTVPLICILYAAASRVFGKLSFD